MSHHEGHVAWSPHTEFLATEEQPGLWRGLVHLMHFQYFYSGQRKWTISDSWGGEKHKFYRLGDSRERTELKKKALTWRMQWKVMINFSSKITKDFCVAVGIKEREAHQWVHPLRNTPSIYNRRILLSCQSGPNINRGIFKIETFPPTEPRKWSTSKAFWSASLSAASDQNTMIYSSLERSCCYLCRRTEEHQGQVSRLEKEQQTGRVLELEVLWWNVVVIGSPEGRRGNQDRPVYMHRPFSIPIPVHQGGLGTWAPAVASTSPPRSSLPNVIVHEKEPRTGVKEVR